MSVTAPPAYDTPPPAPAPRGLAPARSQALGLLLVGLAGLSYTIAGLLGGLTESRTIIMGVAAANLIGALLAWKAGILGRILGLLITLGSLVFTFWIAFGALEVEAPLEFPTGLAYLLGTLLALFGGIAALIMRRPAGTPPGGAGRAIRGLVVVVVVAAAAYGAFSFFTLDVDFDAAAAEGATEVDADDFAFVPDEIEVSADDPRVVVHNGDPALHTFTIDELGIDQVLQPGQSYLIELDAEPGTYTVYCVPHSMEEGEGEDDMAAELTVE